MKLKTYFFWFFLLIFACNINDKPTKLDFDAGSYADSLNAIFDTVDKQMNVLYGVLSDTLSSIKDIQKEYDLTLQLIENQLETMKQIRNSPDDYDLYEKTLHFLQVSKKLLEVKVSNVLTIIGQSGYEKMEELKGLSQEIGKEYMLEKWSLQSVQAKFKRKYGL